MLAEGNDNRCKGVLGLLRPHGRCDPSVDGIIVMAWMLCQQKRQVAAIGVLSFKTISLENPKTVYHDDSDVIHTAKGSSTFILAFLHQRPPSYFIFDMDNNTAFVKEDKALSIS
ncbi:hypothetical protein AN958_01514 [Leucoagaricus sp. SymC.cos]|nr:hypothetical protein AN958_01514 [Leucoagaricus sp. SymC.cos]